MEEKGSAPAAILRGAQERATQDDGEVTAILSKIRANKILA
jgi:hypothetical protein